MRDIKPMVLVVEDEDGVRNLIVTILRLGGYDALHCSDAVAALDLLAVHGDYLQLMVADVNLGPDLGGLELARSLRDSHPHLQVLFISGLVDQGPVASEVILGRAHFLPKPFTPKGLLEKVKSILPGTSSLAAAWPAPREPVLP